MKTSVKDSHYPIENGEDSRRSFLKKGIILATLSGITGITLVTSCKEEGEEEVTPSEDLMREHGVLNRILLIYDACRLRLVSNEPFDLAVLHNSSQIIRTFIEDYHEKLEEDFLFPRFEKANQLTDLVRVLRSQHLAGRTLTDQIMQYGKAKSLTSEDDQQKLIKLLNDFNSMYRPHEAREDTVLFPALRKIITKNEYFALGEDFEDKEHKLFGEDGFERVVENVVRNEKQLGIYELSQFTPE
jgi:hemerythrin-like domain-containing protein